MIQWIQVFLYLIADADDTHSESFIKWWMHKKLDQKPNKGLSIRQQIQGSNCQIEDAGLYSTGDAGVIL